MIAELIGGFEAMSRLLNQTELTEGQVRSMRRVNVLSRWALLNYSRVLIDPVNGGERGNIKLSNATLRCAIKYHKYSPSGVPSFFWYST
jgi:hypothetical protein